METTKIIMALAIIIFGFSFGYYFDNGGIIWGLTGGVLGIVGSVGWIKICSSE